MSQPTTLADLEVKLQRIRVLHAELRLLFRGYNADEVEVMSDEDIVATADALIEAESRS